jgi:3-phytase
MRWWLSLAGALLGAPAAFAQGTAPVATATVTAVAETEPVGTANDDAADDPAIWRNPRNPARSLIVGTDKKAGLHVYGLDGKARHFEPAGRVNNVDLVDLGARGVIVVASDRNDPAAAKLRVYRLDTRTGALAALGMVDGGPGEAYGVCLARERGRLYAFSVLKEGEVLQVRLDLGRDAVRGETVRRLRLVTQPEGCVVDGRTSTLYVGEEAKGVWAFDSRAGRPTEGRLVAPADGAQLVPDVEGLALAPQGRRGGHLVVSSQGDNAYALYRLPDMKPAGRFRVGPGALGATEETDGIDLRLGSFGRGFPGGLLVVQDGRNEPRAQNFKLVSWRDVLRAIKPAR